jgi:hypothetical protein
MEPLEIILYVFIAHVVHNHARKLSKKNEMLALALGHEVEECEEKPKAKPEKTK